MLKKFTLLICMLGSIGLSFANNLHSEDKLIIQSITNGDDDRSNIVSLISADIIKHILVVAFPQDLGEVVVEITTASGAMVNWMPIKTPIGYQFYIPEAGSYIVTFTLSNGNVYFGEFEVTD